jgi:Tfp pilus assembly protein PilF
MIPLHANCIIAVARCRKIHMCVATWVVSAFLILYASTPQFLNAQSSSATDSSTLLTIEGTVEVLPVGNTLWLIARIGQSLRVGDQVRTGARSRATIRLSNLSVLRVSEQMSYEILPPRQPGGKPIIDVKAGAAYFFSRDQPQEIQVQTPVATGAIRGTEFNLTVAADGRTELTLLNGAVELFNNAGAVLLKSGEQGVVKVGEAPVKTAVINAVNIIQWNLYYPAVLDVGELELTDAETRSLSNSLTAYRAGNLLAALKECPAAQDMVSDSEKVYLAELLLSVGLVDQSEAQLNSISGKTLNNARLAAAIRQLVDTVKLVPVERVQPPELASEWLAESYVQQSHSQLAAALMAARKAVKKSSEFGFGWARVAELEFCFGHTSASLAALNKSLQLAPQNAQAITLKGFLLTAQNNIPAALVEFNRAIAEDTGLGNAWLGRGLCAIRQGKAAAGQSDLIVAAAMEPQRSLLRSYLGKAFANNGDMRRAEKELLLAQQLDPNDPTSWLYMALLRQQQNRINQAVQDLDVSIAMNTNRSLFRSRFLLDEDEAVRSANLASIYRDAGMTDVSVREAAKAVDYDYANYSAHLFLSESYDALRDPTRYNLRYETVWFNELLLANLLSPVGGGRLAQHVSAQEYSDLLAADGFGIANSTTVRSDQSLSQQVSQFATFGKTSYSLDLDYQNFNGTRPNNGLNSIEWYSTIKQQITDKDTAMALIEYENYSSGDNFQYYDQSQARPNYNYSENQEPTAVGAWHHEWSPNSHTLVLGGRLVNDQQFSDLATPQLLLIQDSSGSIIGHDFEPFDVNYQSKFNIYTIELNQIQQWDRVTLSVGGRYQSGTFDTQNTFVNPPFLVGPPPDGLFNNAQDTTSTSEGFQRMTGYGYLTVQPFEQVRLTGGFAYDDITYPANYRNPPLTAGQNHNYQIDPKAAIIWEIMPEITLRGIYAESLGGVSLDESYRLEPTELAGFPQTFRSLIPESVVGSVSAPENQIYGGALDFKFATNTFAGLQVEQLNSNVGRSIGEFSLVNSDAPYVPGSTLENLNYRETAMTVSINQLLGKQFVTGASYKYDYVTLGDVLPNVPVAALSTANQQDHATLQEASTYILFNHPSGFFSRLDVVWYHQDNSGYTPALPGEDFFQENIYAGWRFLNRRCEIRLGILNIGNSGYNLNPLNVYTELPRERTFEARVKFIF